MITNGEIRDFFRPYLAQQSLDHCEPHFGRWRKRLHELGCDSIPAFDSIRVEDAVTMNHLTTMFHQARPDRVAAIEHILRDVARIPGRPYKG